MGVISKRRQKSARHLWMDGGGFATSPKAHLLRAAVEGDSEKEPSLEVEEGIQSTPCTCRHRGRPASLAFISNATRARFASPRP